MKTLKYLALAALMLGGISIWCGTLLADDGPHTTYYKDGYYYYNAGSGYIDRDGRSYYSADRIFRYPRQNYYSGGHNANFYYQPANDPNRYYGYDLFSNFNYYRAME